MGEDYKNGLIGYLDKIKRVEVSDGTKEEIVPDISAKLKEVFDRSRQENKKRSHQINWNDVSSFWSQGDINGRSQINN